MTAVTVTMAVCLTAVWWTGAGAEPAYFYAQYQLAIRNNLRAADWAEWARMLNGDAARSEFLKARIHRRLNDLQAMEVHLHAAQRQGLALEQVERERQLALAQSGQMHQVLEELNEWMMNPGDDVADIADAYSLGMQARGRLYETKVVLSVWTADCPSDPKPHVQLARIAEMELRDRDAEKEYRLALEANPDYPMALYAFSQLLLKRKRPEEALPLLERCVKEDPKTKPAVDVVVAGCQRLLAERVSARMRLKQVLATPQKDLVQAYRRLATPLEAGAAAYELGRVEFDDRNFSAAADNFRLAIKQAPDHFDAEYQLGLTLKRLGYDAEADAILERVANKREVLAEIAPFVERIVTEPNNFEARYNIGNILLNRGRVERGLFYLNGALVDAPEHLPTHQRLLDFYKANRTSHAQYAELAEHHQQVVDKLTRKMP